MTRSSARQFQSRPRASIDWRVLSEGACTFFRTGSFAESGRCRAKPSTGIPAIGEHPAGRGRARGGVTVRLISVADDYFG